MNENNSASLDFSWEVEIYLFFSVKFFSLVNPPIVRPFVSLVIAIKFPYLFCFTSSNSFGRVSAFLKELNISCGVICYFLYSGWMILSNSRAEP